MTALFASSEPPIRAELFSVERLEQHAESLAAAQPVSHRPQAGNQLAPRLDNNAWVLTEAYRVLALKYHPDRGGSHEQMVAINDAHDLLRTLTGIQR